MKILIVDDSKAARLRLAHEFSDDRYETHHAESGEHAVDILENGEFDLITVDVEMTGMNGFETCRKIRALNNRNKDIPVIFITGNDSLDGRKHGFEVGAADFLSKNFPPGMLQSVVERILRANNFLTGVKALVVDDAKVSRLIAKSCLQAEGVETTMANDGLSGYELLKNNPNKFDIILLDYNMPGLNGVELCIKIRKELNIREVPVIFLSANEEQGKVLEFFQAGGTDYLAKPYLKEELIARIRAHIETQKLYRKLTDHAKELEKLNQLKDKFLSVCSHDLKSPLNVILGFSQIMLLDYGDDERLGHDIARIQDAGHLLNNLIEDILDLSRLQSADHSLNLAEVDLAKIVSDSVIMLKPLAERKSIKLAFEKGLDSCLLVADELALIRVCSNLVSNAIKFTPTGGKVEVRIDSTNAAEIVLSVEDTGVGMTAEKVAHLFDPHQKTSAAGTDGEPGTGLGLHIVKEIVEHHGGKLQVSSKEGEGSVFSCHLPTSECSKAAS